MEKPPYPKEAEVATSPSYRLGSSCHWACISGLPACNSNVHAPSQLFACFRFAKTHRGLYPPHSCEATEKTVIQRSYGNWSKPHGSWKPILNSSLTLLPPNLAPAPDNSEYSHLLWGFALEPCALAAAPPGPFGGPLPGPRAPPCGRLRD